MKETQVVVVGGNKKSAIVAFLLTFFFGPLGLLYVSVAGALLLIALGLISFFILPLVGSIFIWIISMIWAVVAAARS